MPLISVVTNVNSSEIPADFLRKTSVLVARILGKPSATIQVAVHAGQRVHFFDSERPAAFVHATIVDRDFDLEQRRAIAAELTALVAEELKLDRKRLVLKFPHTTADSVAFDGLLLMDLATAGGKQKGGNGRASKAKL
ncbi:Macrophage migration inhibitory factor-like protein [Aphelenchoides fujianensis]|nr:Macrophage migration inhibitory factor-like protein [Aphelenchoides fujianensis]